MNKSFIYKLKTLLYAALLFTFISPSIACAQSLSRKTDIYAEIQQYEWSDMYKHENTYEEACEIIFCFLPVRLSNGKDLVDSLEIIIDDSPNSFDIFGSELQKSLIPAYGGVYMNGIKMKNRNSFEECYEKTIEVLCTLHKEYIEMGIIQKKAN